VEATTGIVTLPLDVETLMACPVFHGRGESVASVVLHPARKGIPLSPMSIRLNRPASLHLEVLTFAKPGFFLNTGLKIQAVHLFIALKFWSAEPQSWDSGKNRCPPVRIRCVPFSDLDSEFVRRFNDLLV
jgi:hypothetical protein